MQLQLGDAIRVDGWVMLKNLSPGKYRVVEIGNRMGSDYYKFSKLRGRKCAAAHYAASVDAWLRDESCEDLNKIVKIDGGPRPSDDELFSAACVDGGIR